MVFDFRKSILIDQQLVDFTITSRKAISVGIIINELLTNIFKYAFKDRDGGKVSVSMEKTEDRVTLIIYDNGIGIDERILADKSPGFGLTLVRMLVEQMDGTYSIVNENGTKSVVQFNI
jgi:two-component sensor histidine kinase